tara:strand:- start:720 stop:941 length:222 start_codon:yes stop_codon:yes gene_type:complete
MCWKNIAVGKAHGFRDSSNIQPRRGERKKEEYSLEHLYFWEDEMIFNYNSGGKVEFDGFQRKSARRVEVRDGR